MWKRKRLKKQLDNFLRLHQRQNENRTLIILIFKNSRFFLDPIFHYLYRYAKDID